MKNPIADYCARTDTPYSEAARRWGLSRSYVWMLATDRARSLKRSTMRRIAEETGGKVSVAALTRWVDWHAGVGR